MIIVLVVSLSRVHEFPFFGFLHSPVITPRVVSIKIIGIVNIGLVSGSVSLPALRAHVLFFLPALIVPSTPDNISGKSGQRATNKEDEKYIQTTFMETV